MSRCSFLLLTGLVNPEIESSINATKEKKKKKGINKEKKEKSSSPFPHFLDADVTCMS